MRTKSKSGSKKTSGSAKRSTRAKGAATKTPRKKAAAVEIIESKPAPVEPPVLHEPPAAASPSVSEQSSDEPPNRPNPLTTEQNDLDLLTRIELALGIRQTALFGKSGLVASRNFRIMRTDVRLLLDWLEHRMDAALAAMSDPGEEGPAITIDRLGTRLSEPPEDGGVGVPIYGSDMYTLMFYRRGSLWFMAAFDYELEIPYVDFNQWQRDLLAMLDEAGL